MTRLWHWLERFLASWLISAGAGMDTSEYERGLKKLDQHLKERGEY